MRGNKPPRRTPSSPRTPTGASLRLAAIYLVVGALWILLSDRALSFFVRDPNVYMYMQTWKGWFYVAITSVVFALIARAELSRQAKLRNQLASALAEKEALLHELHHRVKNNLQLASSLVSLRMSSLEDEEARSFLAEHLSRLKAIALVQDKIYASNDVAMVDIVDYCKDASDEYSSLYPSWEIGFSSSFKNYHISLEKAVAFALLLDEVVSNSIFHAFVGRQTGSVSIELAPALREGALVLSVRDDGTGFNPTSIEGDSIGFQLIKQLADQLSGSLEYHFEGGTEFSLTFLPNQSSASLSVDPSNR